MGQGYLKDARSTHQVKELLGDAAVSFVLAIIDFAAVVGNREQRIWEQWTIIETNTIRKLLLQEV
ncbi:hypothetical protein [Moorena bouillonii]|uniref:Uncharacterized protein n=1 Tax=Moorena bouillonii PNG TaxID=568701 RepID=A0A1U7N9G2_9CYAN|nr:hypothetical protein [Moorena bouillonii]NEO44037.1 hypothetical protein [Moorena sp. SIO4A3]NEQ62972.1 hypothetical protein [Moorena sp. SIO4A1]OLT62586.1 hypothetical protein BJP37_29720 [Moorena bouillonii PNG]